MPLSAHRFAAPELRRQLTKLSFDHLVGPDQAGEQALNRFAEVVGALDGPLPAGFERNILGAADGRAVAGVAEGVRPANDLLQPLRAVEQGRSLGLHSGRRRLSDRRASARPTLAAS
jgi:hypothetical protein